MDSKNASDSKESKKPGMYSRKRALAASRRASGRSRNEDGGEDEVVLGFAGPQKGL